MSEPKGRGAAWTEERGTSDEGRRRLKAPRRRAENRASGRTLNNPAIEADGLRKTFGQVAALDGLSFQVPAGSVLGLLGPNGSGKTTAVSILSTSLRPDAGRATVCGLDVVADAPAVRGLIGFAGQFAAVDPNLTGRENLALIGRLSRVGHTRAHRYAAARIRE